VVDFVVNAKQIFPAPCDKAEHRTLTHRDNLREARLVECLAAEQRCRNRKESHITNVRSSLSPAMYSVLHPATSEPHSPGRLVFLWVCGSARQNIRDALREFPLHRSRSKRIHEENSNQRNSRFQDAWVFSRSDRIQETYDIISVDTQSHMSPPKPRETFEGIDSKRYEQADTSIFYRQLA
jgi:hypothetical protein